MLTVDVRPIMDMPAPMGPRRRMWYRAPWRSAPTLGPIPRDSDHAATQMLGPRPPEGSRCYLSLDNAEMYDLHEEKTNVCRSSSGSVERRGAMSCQDGISSGEFALTLFVVAAAILAGVMGGIWIAEREGLIKQEASALEKAAGPPAEQSSVSGSEQAQQAAPSSTAQANGTGGGTTLAGPTSLGLRSIRAIHFSSQPDLARVEIEVLNVVVVRAAQLHNPERVYVDLQDSWRPPGPAGRMQANRTISVGDALLASVRVAQWESGATRIVLDVTRPCEFSHRLTPEPSSRLIMEVRPRQASARIPAASARYGAL